MPSPAQTLQFRYNWRHYQQRVLDLLPHHIIDRRLHIVAAPGAGKTTLGLEVFRQLDQRCLVLSPTRIIRDQWISRLEDFVPPNAQFPPVWTSTHLDTPAFFTSITYQALHTKFREIGPDVDTDALPRATPALNKEELAQFIARFKAAGFKTLILDEAHHLRSAWWQALNEIVEGIPDLQLVSLTATPPLDVTNSEWKRYQALCGPIDEEISIPELVKDGVLCPHQDYIWIAETTALETKAVQDYDVLVTETLESLADSRLLQDAVLRNPLLQSPEADLALFGQKLPTVIACLAYLQSAERDLPLAPLALLGITAADLPVLNREQWQLILAEFFFGNTFALSAAEKPYQKLLVKQFREDKLLYRRTLRLTASKPIENLIAGSIKKVSACGQIYQVERQSRQDSLRMVILTDFIRDDHLDNAVIANRDSLGAWPILKLLAAKHTVHQADFALISGRLALLHADQLPALQALLPDVEVISKQFVAELPYVQVTARHSQLPQAFTALLKDGVIKVLVGTRSLLGEGWDAPFVNTLVFASGVRTYMLTNQMRGRALRSDENDLNKVASIWHIVGYAKNPTYDADHRLHSGWAELHTLVKRFRVFVGIAEKDTTITSGLHRLGIPYLAEDDARYQTFRPWALDVDAANDQMIARALERDALNRRWTQATRSRTQQFIVPEVRVQYPIVEDNLLHKIGISRHGRLITKIAKATLAALCAAKIVQTPKSKFKVGKAIDRKNGIYRLYLTGGTYHEKKVFIDALYEALSAIDSPRYLVHLRKNIVGWPAPLGFHLAVPSVLAKNKENAAHFAKALKKQWLRNTLRFVHNAQHRERLLTIRANAITQQQTMQVSVGESWR